MSEFKDASKYNTQELNAFLDELSQARIKIASYQGSTNTMIQSAMDKAILRYEGMTGKPMDDTTDTTVFDAWCVKNFPELQAATVIDGKTAKDRLNDKISKKGG